MIPPEGEIVTSPISLDRNILDTDLIIKVCLSNDEDIMTLSNSNINLDYSIRKLNIVDDGGVLLFVDAFST